MPTVLVLRHQGVHAPFGIADAVLQHAEALLERLQLLLPSAERLDVPAHAFEQRGRVLRQLRRFALRLLPGFAGGFEIRRGFLRQLLDPADRVFDLGRLLHAPRSASPIWTSIAQTISFTRLACTTACSTACCWLSSALAVVRRARQAR